jgi:hypothetical protein
MRDGKVSFQIAPLELVTLVSAPATTNTATSAGSATSAVIVRALRLKACASRFTCASRSSQAGRHKEDRTPRCQPLEKQTRGL